MVSCAEEKATAFTVNAQIMISVLLIGLASAFFYHALRSRIIPPIGFPYDTFLFQPGDRFGDFSSTTMTKGSAEVANATPFTIVFGWFWATITVWLGYAWAYTLYVVGWVSLLAYSLRKLMGASRSALLVSFLMIFLSYPVIFDIDRGNIAGWVVSVMALGLTRLRERHYRSTALFFAMAASMKITPLILGVFFVRERRWKDLFLFLFLGFALTSLSALAIRFWVLPTYGSHNFGGAMQFYWDNYVILNAGQAWGSSLWGGIKLFLYCCGMKDIRHVMTVMLPYYDIFTMTCLGLLGLSFLTKRISFSDQVSLVCTWLMLMPHVMADYYLTLMLLPLALLCNKHDRRSTFLLVCLSLSVIPKAYMWFAQTSATGSALFNPLLLLVVFVSSLKVSRPPMPTLPKLPKLPKLPTALNLPGLRITLLK